MKKIIIMLAVIYFTGCSYSVYTSGYPHLKTIEIDMFENSTTQYQLEEKVLNQISQEFQKDGRLKLASLNPDCKLEGEILDYSNKIREYGNVSIDEYQVRILFKIIFTDLSKNLIIWQNNSIALSENYSQSNLDSQFSTEEEAQEEIISKLFLKIINESLEQW